MATETHVNIPAHDKSGNQIVFHNPGQQPQDLNAGQTMVTTKDSTGKTLTAHGQITISSTNAVGPIFLNPA